MYDKIANMSILLAAGDFSPDGVLRYTLDSPLHFQSGDVLGVYQPADANSTVGIFYSSEDEDAPVAYWQQHNPSSVSIITTSAISGQRILIHPETGKFSMYSYDCIMS